MLTALKLLTSADISGLCSDSHDSFLLQEISKRKLDSLKQANQLTKGVKVYLVMDEAFLFKTCKEFISGGAKEQWQCDYRVKGEFYYQRPYFDEFIRLLCSH